VTDIPEGLLDGATETTTHTRPRPSLVEFLTARLDEDEAAAGRCSGQAWAYHGVDSVAGGSLYDGNRMIASIDWDNEPPTLPILRYLPEATADGNGEHIARWDPARVLAEVAAKRAVIANFCRYDAEARATGHYMDVGASGYALEAVEHLATVYAAHPDYDEAWRA
jgi:hypothetical protein